MCLLRAMWELSFTAKWKAPFASWRISELLGQSYKTPSTCKLAAQHYSDP